MSNNISIRSATPADAEALRILVPDVFTRKGPLSVHLKHPPEVFLAVYDEATRHLDFNTSVVATTPSGEIVAALLCAPNDAPFDVTRVHPASAPASAVMNSLRSWLKDNCLHVPRSKVLHALFAATKDEFEGMGLSKLLCAASLEKAREAGWEMVVAECVTPVTQHIMRDLLGYSVGKEVVYRDFEYMDTKPFEQLNGSAMYLYKEL